MLRLLALMVTCLFFVAVGCSFPAFEFPASEELDLTNFDSSKMDGIYIGDNEFKKKYIGELEKNSISYSQINILDGKLYIVTNKIDAEKVNKIYEEVVGIEPSNFSVSFSSGKKIDSLIQFLEERGLKYREVKFYGERYIEWSETDDVIVRSIILKNFALDLEKIRSGQGSGSISHETL